MKCDCCKEEVEKVTYCSSPAGVGEFCDECYPSIQKELDDWERSRISDCYAMENHIAENNRKEDAEDKEPVYSCCTNWLIELTDFTKHEEEINE